MVNALIIIDYPEPLSSEYLSHMRERFPDITTNLAVSITDAEPYIAAADVIITFPRLMTDDVFRKGPSIRWIHCLTTGTDGVDDLPSLKPDILVTNSHGIHRDSVSEHAILLMLALSRHLHDHVRFKEKHRWTPIPARLLHGKHVGIFGVGVIGEGLASRAKAMGMIVHGISRVQRRVGGIDKWHTWSDVVEMMPQLDYVVVLMPLTPRTRGIFDAKLLGRMKPTAYFINVARGGLVDEKALIDLLKKGKIAGAGLDTVIEEPLQEDSPLWDLPNVIITPHNAGRFDEYAKYVFPILDENMRCFIAGESSNMINLVEHRDSLLQR